MNIEILDEIRRSQTRRTTSIRGGMGRLMAAALAAVIGLGGLMQPAQAQTAAANAAMYGAYGAYSGIWFDKDAAWNSPIPPTTLLSTLATTYSTLLPKLPTQNPTYPYYYGESVIESFIATGKAFNNDWDGFSVYVVPAQGAGSSDVLTNYAFKDPVGYKWLLPNVPMNPNVVAAVKYALSVGDTDDMVCIYDASQNGFYTIWKATVSTDGQSITSIQTGGFFPMTGVGWSSTANGKSPSSGRVSAASYCAGVIRPDEFATAIKNNASLPHALALAWPVAKTIGYNTTKPTNNSAQGAQALFTSLATNTDGTAPDYNSGIHMGARLQLDPTLTDTQLASLGITAAADKVIAHTLQKYGGFVIDTTASSATLVLYWESQYGKGKATYGATQPWMINKLATTTTSSLHFLTAGWALPCYSSSYTTTGRCGGGAANFFVNESAYPNTARSPASPTGTIPTNPVYKPILCTDVVSTFAATTKVFHGTTITQDMVNKCNAI